MHVTSKGGKVGNHKSVTITAKVNAKGKAIKKYKALSKTVVKKGKKITLKGKLVPASKKLKVKKHRSLVYESSNPKVAKISGKGVVKALKKGTATIYAYAQNGVFKSVRITVK
ncbi:MAG: Ig-like domain-containing protein [Firmicutes bacterium]|nr:Ig-like domain-containing protein [Bacillota bacterium]